MNSSLEFLKKLASLRFRPASSASVASDLLRPGFTRPIIEHATIEHSAFQRCASEIAAIHEQYLERGKGRCAAIVGQSGSGKSELIRQYCEWFPIEQRDGFDKIPVLVVQTPAKPSLKNFSEAFIHAFGIPTAGHATETKITKRLLQLFDDHEVQLIAIDEFQHFVDHSPSATKEVTDWLKALANACKRPIVVLGLPRSLQIIRRNVQMRRRFSRILTLTPFTADTTEAWQEFRAVLREIHRRTPVEALPFHEPDTARRFLAASEGLMDYLIRIVETSVEIAAAKRKPIDLLTLAAAFESEIWPGCPTKRNPFLAEDALHSLRGAGEPFELWDTYQ
jgi:energy-coupling factor transporter ATP-binding protein EcfA2